MTGYSTTPLVQKLGIQPNFKMLWIEEPHNFRKLVGELPKGVQILKKPAGLLDYIHLFTTDRGELELLFRILKQHLQPAGMLWISWPKQSAGAETDLDENIVRDIGLHNGLVDVKVCAVDETWSGLKFVRRVKDRN